MITRLFSGWFKPMNVSPLEGFFLRLLFAGALIYTIRVTGQFNLPNEPHPVGLLKILHRLADGPGVTDHSQCRTWLTWLADPDKFEIYRWCFVGVLIFYVAGIALPVVLPLASVMHILPYTLFGSQEYNFHGASMISLVLLAQALTVLYHAIFQKCSFKPPDAKLRGWMLLQSMVIVTGAYFVSVFAKMENSDGEWFMNSNNVALDMIKTDRQTYFNQHRGPIPVISSEDLKLVREIGITDVIFRPKSYPVQVVATWLLEHPWTSRILFSSGVLLETVCILAIGNRILALFFGLSLIAFHRSIDALMGGVAFPFNELCDFIFLIGIPFGLAWTLERIKNIRVRHALLIGAGIGVVASYWFHEKTGAATSSLCNYLLSVNYVIFGTWSSQDWSGFFEYLNPVIMSAAAGALAAAFAVHFWQGKKFPQTTESTS
ncbi:MAG: hypothetical protein K8R87_01385 [Verrucomicrobia bacterium]|nr:hypothetical protein [Verrucomicrobiota bacterium]